MSQDSRIVKKRLRAFKGMQISSANANLFNPDNCVTRFFFGFWQIDIFHPARFRTNHCFHLFQVFHQPSTVICHLLSITHSPAPGPGARNRRPHESVVRWYDLISPTTKKRPYSRFPPQLSYDVPGESLKRSLSVSLPDAGVF